MVLGAGPPTPLRVYRQLIVAGGREVFFSVIATSKCPCSCKWSFTHDLVSHCQNRQKKTVEGRLLEEEQWVWEEDKRVMRNDNAIMK